jgi:hypothetical protein
MTPCDPVAAPRPAAVTPSASGFAVSVDTRLLSLGRRTTRQVSLDSSGFREGCSTRRRQPAPFRKGRTSGARQDARGRVLLNRAREEGRGDVDPSARSPREGGSVVREVRWSLNTDGGDVVRGVALTPVIAIRDSDEITAVWLVPQLVLLKTIHGGKPCAVPNGGVRNVEDTSRQSGYKRATSSQGRTAPENRVPASSVPKHSVGGSSSLEGRSVAFGFPRRREQYSSGVPEGTTRQVSLDG